jgi:GNAT superfamily N-acetyltransferase
MSDGRHRNAPGVTETGLAIREAREADLRRIVELLTLGPVPGGPPSTEDPSDLGPYRAALRDIVESGGTVLVAEQPEQPEQPERPGVVVGVCQLIVFRHLQAHGGLCAEIESVHVHPEHRGRGVGAALIEEAVARARALGCYRVQLTSNADRPDAHRFYECLGLRPTHVGFKLPLE